MQSSHKKRILYFEPVSQRGGSQASLRILLKGLDRETIEPILVFGDRAHTDDWGNETVFELRSARLDNYDFSPAGWNLRWVYHFALFVVNFVFDPVRIPLLLRRIKPDIVHINAGQALSWGIIAKIMRIPVVWHVRELVAKNAFGRLQDRIYAKCADQIIAVSKAVAGRLPRCHGKITVLHDAIAPEPPDPHVVQDLRRGANVTESDFVLLLLADVSLAKGYGLLAEVADKLSDVPDIRFLLAGQPDDPPAGSIHRCLRFVYRHLLRQGSDRSRIVEKWSAHLKDERAILTGYVDASAAIAISDVVVCPNTVGESFGRTIIEAYAQGRPVLATDIEPFNETVEHGKTGFLLAQNADVWAKLILKLSKDQELMHDLQEHARNRARDYDHRDHARCVMNIYDTVLKMT